ncbi:hypothetical protein PG994_003380 [Apiospora phragmitis]|uniref:Rhodopsin domain-containing protein n=1 Tax=Apiospora phragmitis TaxID=2905665 RepID=A0ABR1VY01_9PEZI
MDSEHFWALSPAEQEKVLLGPALPPPPGIEPDFDNPPNRNGVVVAVCSTCLIIGSFFVFVRVSGMGRSWRKIHISDYFGADLMLVAFGLYVAFVAVLLRESHVGFLVHQWNFRLQDLPEILYLFTLATNFFTASIMLLKAAIVLEWLHIFVPRGTRNNYFYWISVALLAVNFLFNSAAIIVINLTCTPHAKAWDQLLPGHCFDGRGLYVASAVVNFVLDLVILVLPQKVIWGLNMSVQKRLGVSAVFVVGLIACIAAALRIPVSVKYSHSQDVTYDFCTVGIWTIVEATCGLIVLCTPALPKALSKLGALGIYPFLKSWTKSADSKRSGIKMSGIGKSTLHHNNNIRDGRPEQHQYLELSDHRHSPSGSGDIGKFPNPAILRTTRVDIGTEEAENHRASRQHPWEQGST